MQTDFLDKHERQYLQSCQWPPRAWLRAFFWYFLPAIGAASVATQYARGLDVGDVLVTAGIFAALSLAYFPLVRLVVKPFSYRVVNWSGVARRVAAKKGNVGEDFIGERRVFLPIGWDEHFHAFAGREIDAHGVLATEATESAPSVQLLSLNRTYFVSREAPAGLTKLELPQLYFGLALVPIGVMFVLALKIRFQFLYLLFFGLVSIGFALYGMYVSRRNAGIRDVIANMYGNGRDPNLLYVNKAKL